MMEVVFDETFFLMKIFSDENGFDVWWWRGVWWCSGCLVGGRGGGEGWDGREEGVFGRGREGCFFWERGGNASVLVGSFQLSRICQHDPQMCTFGTRAHKCSFDRLSSFLLLVRRKQVSICCFCSKVRRTGMVRRRWHNTEWSKQWVQVSRGPRLPAAKWQYHQCTGVRPQTTQTMVFVATRRRIVPQHRRR